MHGFLLALFDREFSGSALKVAIIVGSFLFVINHGWAVLTGDMSLPRWMSGILTYGVPYIVNVHGQYTSRSRTWQNQLKK